METKKEMKAAAKEEEAKKLVELCKLIRDHNFTNFTDFYFYVIEHYPDDKNYFKVMNSNSGLLSCLTKGNYQNWVMSKEYGTKYGNRLDK